MNSPYFGNFIYFLRMKKFSPLAIFLSKLAAVDVPLYVIDLTTYLNSLTFSSESYIKLVAARCVLSRFDRGDKMPRGPRGEKRPADLIGCAATVARLSVGEMDEQLKEPSAKVRSGHAGARARAASMTAERRTEIAKKAARERWG
jgi:hypothetical protein